MWSLHSPIDFQVYRSRFWRYDFLGPSENLLLYQQTVTVHLNSYDWKVFGVFRVPPNKLTSVASKSRTVMDVGEFSPKIFKGCFRCLWRTKNPGIFCVFRWIVCGLWSSFCFKATNWRANHYKIALHDELFQAVKVWTMGKRRATKRRVSKTGGWRFPNGNPEKNPW